MRRSSRCRTRETTSTRCAGARGRRRAHSLEHSLESPLALMALCAQEYRWHEPSRESIELAFERILKVRTPGQQDGGSQSRLACCSAVLRVGPTCTWPRRRRTTSGASWGSSRHARGGAPTWWWTPASAPSRCPRASGRCLTRPSPPPRSSTRRPSTSPWASGACRAARLASSKGERRASSSASWGLVVTTTWLLRCWRGGGLRAQGAVFQRPVLPAGGRLCLLGVQVPEQAHQGQPRGAALWRQPHRGRPAHHGRQHRHCLRGEQRSMGGLGSPCRGAARAHARRAHHPALVAAPLAAPACARSS